MARITILSLDISARALCLGEIYYPGFFFFTGRELNHRRKGSNLPLQIYPRALQGSRQLWKMLSHSD